MTGIPAGPKAGPNLSLGELTCRLIERWDELESQSREEILRSWSRLPTRAQRHAGSGQ